MQGFVRQFQIIIVGLLSSIVSAHAEDLVMPYACRVIGGEPQLSLSKDTSYKIFGEREERPFVSCPTSKRGQCETLMIHRFMIGCDGQRVAWAKVANAARASGVALPDGLPAGFAPVSSVSGRFVFPALTHDGAAVEKVASVELSPESIVKASFDDTVAGAPSWVTTVSANSVPEKSGDALRVALTLAGVLAVLAFACFMAAGRRYISVWQSSVIWLRKEYDEWNKSAERAKGGDTAPEFANLLTRLAEAEHLVAALPPGLLVRGVLSAELAQIRQRAAHADRAKSRDAADVVAAHVRALLRDIDRVIRMAVGATQTADRDNGQADIPQSAAEAYSVLGLNADVLPAVAKKLVDALRQTWHPDFARNEDDRRRREDRMKQINAAWELIKDQRAAA